MTRNRARAMALALNARLLSASSATDALRAWCEEHGLAEGEVVARLHARDAAPHVGAEVHERLQAAAAEPVQHRQVSLVRGGLVLCDADNWFLPSRLPWPMRDALDRTNTPFGAVVRRLRPSRRTFFARLARRARDAGGIILEHRAVVLRHDNVPIAVVHERYRSDLVSFAA